MLTKTYLQNISYKIIGCAIEVHRHLGPGLLESFYEMCIIEELKRHDLKVQSQIYLPVVYKDTNLGGTLKLDLLVEDAIVVELKAVEMMIPLYKAQLLSYMKLADKQKGLLINFNCEVIKDQVASMVSEKYKTLPD